MTRRMLVLLSVAGLGAVPAACGDPAGPGGPVEREEKEDPGKDETGGASALLLETAPLG